MDDHPTLPFEEAEEWLPVVGWEMWYEVSDLGRVRSIRRVGQAGQQGGRVIRPRPLGGYGYLGVNLSRPGGFIRTYTVHTLVLGAFVGPRPEGQVCRHGPGGGHDNRLVNLCYGTHEENNRDQWRDGTVLLGERANTVKLTEGQVREIRARYAKGERVVVLVREYGVSQPTINSIIRRATWKHVA